MINYNFYILKVFLSDNQMFINKILYKLILNKKFLRSYLIIVKKNKLNLLNTIKYDIYNIIDNNYDTEFKKNAKELNKLLTHQFFVSKIIFNNSIFNALCIKCYVHKKNIILPLPIDYLKIIEKNGISVNYIFSKILLNIFYFIIFFKNTMKVIRLLFIKKKNSKEDIDIFFGLNNSNIPLSNKYKGGIIHWAINNFKLSKKLIIHRNINHDIKYKNYKLKNDNFYSYLKVKKNNKYLIIFNSVKNILRATITLFKKDKFEIIILFEKVLKDFVNMSEANYLIKNLFFHHSSVLNGYIYRPYWTYFCDQKTNIYLYFYSLSFDHHKSVKDKALKMPFNLISWPNIITWNQYNSEMFKSHINKNVRLIEKSAVSFISSNKSLKIHNGVYIFDQYPSTKEIFYSAGHNSTFPKLTNAMNFIKDILKVCKIHNVPVYIKNKRKPGINYNKKYLNFLNELIESNKLIRIDYEISYEDLFVNKSIISICKPFTSIGFVSKEYGVNTIYYDNTKKLVRNDNAHQNIKLISGIDCLNEYLYQKLNVLK